MTVSGNRTKQAKHYFRVFVGGYVFPELPAEASEADVEAKAAEMVEAGDLDITQTTVEASFDD